MSRITREQVEHQLKDQKGQSVCPRCGKSFLKKNLHTNALSRRADVYVCDKCGMNEALQDVAGITDPFEDWFISKFIK